MHLLLFICQWVGSGRWPSLLLYGTEEREAPFLPANAPEDFGGVFLHTGTNEITGESYSTKLSHTSIMVSSGGKSSNEGLKERQGERIHMFTHLITSISISWESPLRDREIVCERQRRKEIKETCYSLFVAWQSQSSDTHTHYVIIPNCVKLCYQLFNVQTLPIILSNQCFNSRSLDVCVHKCVSTPHLISKYLKNHAYDSHLVKITAPFYHVGFWGFTHRHTHTYIHCQMEDTGLELSVSSQQLS